MSSPEDQDDTTHPHTHAHMHMHTSETVIYHPVEFFAPLRTLSMDAMPGPVVEVEQGFGIKLDGDAVRYGLTLLIITTALVISQSVPGVFVVWTMAGSTLTVVICYLLPAAAYITAWKKLGRDKVVDGELIGCYVMFSVGVMLMLICTPQAICNALI